MFWGIYLLMVSLEVSIDEIRRAAEVISGKALRTPLVYSHAFSEMVHAQVYLKLENLQRGGSFKIRGATYKVQMRRGQIGHEGVIAASIGNHAQGVALAAKAAGLPATVVMPVWTSIAKQEATKGYGAEVILKGKSLVESIEVARSLGESTGKMFIHPYDDPDLIAGQGTIALEIFDDLPDIDAIVVPVGGGGLIGGIAIASKAISPGTKIIGVQAQACPSAFMALKEGHPVLVGEMDSIADAIMVTQVGDADFPVLRDKVDEVVLVSEDQIASAVLMMLERKKILAEGAAATPLAALLNSKFSLTKGGKVVLVVSGGNIDSLLLDKVMRQGLLQEGRTMRISLRLKDAPGSLAGLLDLVAKLQANVIQIYHYRTERGLPISSSRVDLELETRGLDHVVQIAAALKSVGYEIELS
jgi:threonine dehydratase